MDADTLLAAAKLLVEDASPEQRPAALRARVFAEAARAMEHGWPEKRRRWFLARKADELRAENALTVQAATHLAEILYVDATVTEPERPSLTQVLVAPKQSATRITKRKPTLQHGARIRTSSRPRQRRTGGARRARAPDSDDGSSPPAPARALPVGALVFLLDQLNVPSWRKGEGVRTAWCPACSGALSLYFDYSGTVCDGGCSEHDVLRALREAW